MKRLAILTTAALLVLCLGMTALADVAVGDRGEEVRYLQWLLKQTGWLSDNPDGIFGPHTEKAVIDCQTAMGREPTGVADAELMLELDQERVLKDKELHGADYYQPYTGNFTPPMAASASAASYCATSVLPGISWQKACERHLDLSNQTAVMVEAGDADSLAEATALWLEDIADQLKEQAAASPAQRGALESLGAAIEADIAEQREALTALGADSAAVELQALEMAQNWAQAMCEAREGEMPAAVSIDTISQSRGDAACARWAFSRGRVFFTACDAHAPLIAREHDWITAGASDEEALAGIARDWESALAAQYEAWASREGDPAAAQSARAAHESAALMLDGAFTGSSATLCRMRLSQLETERLCALLGG